MGEAEIADLSGKIKITWFHQAYLAKMIHEGDSVKLTGKVTESRAKLIARTEIARTSNGLTMARATHIGVTHYVWRSSQDGSVRESHKKMNGSIIPFDHPPEVEPGERYHAGMIYNCRCFMEPILLD